MSSNALNWVAEQHAKHGVFEIGQKRMEVSENRKQDRRIERTREALSQAMMALLQDKSWEELNVRMLCEEANIARSSFYLHFTNKQELLDYIFAQRTKFASMKINAIDTQADEFAIFTWLTQHISEGRSFFKRASTEQSPIFHRFKQAIAEAFAEEAAKKGHQLKSDTVSFIIGGTFSLLGDWVISNCQKDQAIITEQINRYALQIIGKGR